MIRREPLRFMPPDDIKGPVEPDRVTPPARPRTPEDGLTVETPERGQTHAVRGEGGR